MMTLKGLEDCERGQAIVEVAILAPLLMLLLVTVIDIGRLVHYNIVVGNSARAGVQFGAQRLTTAVDSVGMLAAAQAEAQTLVFSASSSAGPVYKCSDTSNPTGSGVPPTICPSNTHLITYATVTIVYQFHSLFHYPLIHSPINLSRTQIMQVAQ